MSQSWWEDKGLGVEDGMSRINRFIAENGREEFDLQMRALDEIAAMIKRGEWPVGKARQDSKTV